jgi:hypothetical protein
VETEQKHGFAPSFFRILRKLRQRKSSAQWTDRLAEFSKEAKHDHDTSVGLDGNANTSLARGEPVSLRLEGPYFTPADPSRYRTVVCFVAGTGVSGALAISGAFKELERQSACARKPGSKYRRPKCTVGGDFEMTTANSKAGSVVSFRREPMWIRCIVVWIVREDTYIDLPGFTGESISRHR